MELYKEYVSEREGFEVLSDKDSFISYKLISPEELYIADMFIKKPLRKIGKGRELIEAVSDIAKGRGCKILSANVRLNDPGASNTMLGALMVGFRIFGANNQSIIIVKDLEG